MKPQVRKRYGRWHVMEPSRKAGPRLRKYIAVNTYPTWAEAIKAALGRLRVAP
jgi:hypothetical protein